MVGLWAVLLWFGALGSVATGLSVDPRKLPGIWKLHTESLPYKQHAEDIREKLKGILLPEEEDIIPRREQLLIKLNPDGSFRQCNEGYQEGRWMVGRWELHEEQKLVLAMGRQYYGPQFDVLLEGRIVPSDATTNTNSTTTNNSTTTTNLGSSSLCVEGEIQKGKFMYPPNHPSFFDNPMVRREPLGPFRFEQSVATFSVVVPSEVRADPSKDNRFAQSDFYDRRFILTIEPLPNKPAKAAPGEDRRPQDDQSESLPVDIRAMPIHFFRNNTFEARGTNKLLRGRFSIREGDRLAFYVSLFGIGRSIKGSVFSEGIGLTHDDKRSYLGAIQEKDGLLYVDGFVTFGDDMGPDARPEPVGRFLLTETDGKALSMEDEDEDEDDDDGEDEKEDDEDTNDTLPEGVFQ